MGFLGRYQVPEFLWPHLNAESKEECALLKYFGSICLSWDRLPVLALAGGSAGKQRDPPAKLWQRPRTRAVPGDANPEMTPSGLTGIYKLLQEIIIFITQ